MNSRLSREQLLRLIAPLAILAGFVIAEAALPGLKPVIDLALPFFGLIGLGYTCGVIFETPVEGLAWLNIFIIWLAVPSLLFTLVAATPLAELANGRFVLCTGGATATIFALAFAYGRLVLRTAAPEATIAAMAAAYANIGYMGPGLTFALMGAAAAAPTALIFMADTAFLFSILPVAMALGQGGRGGVLETARIVVWRIVTHPFNIATLAAICAAGWHWHPPAAAARVLQLLSGAAAPCALFALGVTVGSRPVRRLAPGLPVLLALKLLGHPLLVLVYLSALGGFDRVWVVTAVLMASLPPALNVFVMATQYKVYVERASSAILLGTVASVITVTLFLWLASSGHLPTTIF